MSNENRLLASVHAVTTVLSSSVNPDSALRLMLEAAIQAVDASGGSILLHDSAAHQLWFNLVLGGEAQGSHLSAGFGLYGVAIRDDEGIAGQVFQSQTPHIENNPATNPQHAKRIDKDFEFETRNMISVPLRYPGGLPFGVMQLVNKREGAFTEEDLMVLDIVANISAMNLRNSDLAKQAQRTKSLDYLGRAIHDVANKVSRLDGPVQALTTAQEEALSPLATADADAVRQDLRERMQNISAGIKDLLRYTDFMAGVVAGQPLELRREYNNLVAVAEHQLSLLDDVAEGHGVELKRDFEADFSVYFPFDCFLLERAIFNLVNNALKATPSGGTITVRVAEEDGCAVLAVRDTGNGMLPSKLAKIVSNVAGAAPGTGLSTTIVREVAEMHGGTLEGESATGGGTTFRLRLPMHVEEA